MLLPWLVISGQEFPVSNSGDWFKKVENSSDRLRRSAGQGARATDRRTGPPFADRVKALCVRDSCALRAGNVPGRGAFWEWGNLSEPERAKVIRLNAIAGFVFRFGYGKAEDFASRGGLR